MWVLAIDAGFTAKNVSSYPNERMREKAVQELLCVKKIQGISPFSSFYPQ